MKNLSVIIPMYNTQKYISTCLDSLLEQTYKDFEVVIIDDGSTDKGPDIVKKYIKFDKRIQLFTQKNRGPSVARNRGIELSKGKYLYFLDSDDYINKYTFEKCIYEYENNDIDLITFDAKVTYEKKYYETKNRDYISMMSSFYDRSSIFLESKAMNSEDFVKTGFLKDKFKGNVVLYFFKKDTIVNNIIKFNDGIKNYEDFLFLYYILKNTKKVKYLSEPFYFRRLTGNSLTTKLTNESNKEKARDILICLKRIDEDNYRGLIKSIYLKYFIKILFAFWLKCDIKDRDELQLTEITKILFSNCEEYEKIKRQLESEYNSNIEKFERVISD